MNETSHSSLSSSSSLLNASSLKSKLSGSHESASADTYRNRYKKYKVKSSSASLYPVTDGYDDDGTWAAATAPGSSWETYTVPSDHTWGKQLSSSSFSTAQLSEDYSGTYSEHDTGSYHGTDSCHHSGSPRLLTPDCLQLLAGMKSAKVEPVPTMTQASSFTEPTTFPVNRGTKRDHDLADQAKGEGRDADHTVINPLKKKRRSSHARQPKGEASLGVDEITETRCPKCHKYFVNKQGLGWHTKKQLCPMAHIDSLAHGLGNDINAAHNGHDTRHAKRAREDDEDDTSPRKRCYL